MSTTSVSFRSRERIPLALADAQRSPGSHRLHPLVELGIEEEAPTPAQANPQPSSTPSDPTLSPFRQETTAARGVGIEYARESHIGSFDLIVKNRLAVRPNGGVQVICAPAGPVHWTGEAMCLLDLRLRGIGFGSAGEA